LVVNHVTAPQGWRGGSDVLAFVAVLPVAWALGVAARGDRALLAAAEQQVEDGRRERHLLAERAAVAERVRIARDMHDVVAHSLSLLVMHAETVRARSGELPPWAREGIDALAAAGRRSTGEMRDLLGVLREGTVASPRRPVPTLGEMDGLVQTARDCGNPVSLTTTGPLDELPRPVQLAGYRIVQESLSNARRHAPGAEVTVRLDASMSRLELEITSGPASRPIAPVPGSGLGLAGLAERVNALGGDLRAGPTREGGFRVGAAIPIPMEGRDGVR
jgi:signal transduction histidine kinase